MLDAATPFADGHHAVGVGALQNWIDTDLPEYSVSRRRRLEIDCRFNTTTEQPFDQSIRNSEAEGESYSV
jgi:hypothetical protein